SLIVGEAFRADDSLIAGPRVGVKGDTREAAKGETREAAKGETGEASQGESGKAAQGAGTPLLAVEGLTRAGRFYDITFHVKPGEIVGLAGLLGSGRTEIQKAIAAIEPAEAGTVRLDGRVIKPQNPAEALKLGIVYLPEDRDEEGLITSLDVRTNVTLSTLRQMMGGLFLKRSREDDLVSRMVRR